MRRSFFVVGSAMTIAGCAGVTKSVPSGRTRSTNVFQESPSDGGGGGGGATATPIPVDPNAGLKYIGGTHARWGDDYWMAMSYGDMFMQQLPFAKNDFLTGIQQCGLQMAAAIASASAFITHMWATFGPRIAAALGGVAFTELTLWEAVGVALSTVSTSDIVLAGIASIATILDLYLAYICIGSL